MALEESTTGTGLDVRVVGLGAAVTLAVVAPALAIVAVLGADEAPGQESNLWVVVCVAVLAGFAAGGFFAGRRRPATPMLHAAAAGGAAFAAILLYSAGRRLLDGDGLSFAYVVRILLLAQICVSTALLGGYVATRRSR